MAETVWYYARGEVERGPFTAIQIKALANAGKLRADDLVWKEGMENWTSASEVTELFDRTNETKVTVPAGNSEPAFVQNPLLQRANRKRSEFESVVTVACRASIFVGMLCVVLVQGCESVGERRIAGLADGAKVPSAASPAAGESSTAGSPEILQARALLSAGAFGRGIMLYGGVLFLLVGAGGLATFASATDRWLGIAILSIVCFCLLTEATRR